MLWPDLKINKDWIKSNLNIFHLSTQTIMGIYPTYGEVSVYQHLKVLKDHGQW